MLKAEHRAAPNAPPPIAHVGRRPPGILPPFQRPRVEDLHGIYVPPPVKVSVPVEHGPPEHVELAVEGDEARSGVLEFRRKGQLVDDEPGVGRLAVALDPARETRLVIIEVKQTGVNVTSVNRTKALIGEGQVVTNGF